MIKLKKQRITNLINYQHFLQNNYLKNKKYKLNNILFENNILFKNINLESYVIEFNSYKNIYLPFTLIKINEISTINKKYKDIILFNYDLTYNILYQFNKIVFKYIIKKNNIIKARLLRKSWNNKKIIILILGIVFFMKPVNLNNIISYNRKRKYFNKYNKKKINLAQLVNSYKLRYLNFKIKNLNKFKKSKKEFSRVDYVRTIIKNKKILNRKLRR